MANIQPQIDDIRNARYGRDVRESIATGLEAMNAESSDAYSAAITAQTSATASAQQASQSATDASNSASSASQSAIDAQNASQGVQTALTQAQQASATAQASASAAQTAEQNAQASETNAKSSETNAQTSETNAKAYSQSAQSASATAQGAATTAQASASAASNSQTASATSAQNAKTSEENARQWAEQASSIVNIDTMTTSKNGIGRPDGTSITVNQFGVFSATGIETHANKQIASNDGVHGERVLDGKLQHWDEGLSKWVTDIEEVKVDGVTLKKDSTDRTLSADLSTVAPAWENKGYTKGANVTDEGIYYECLLDHATGLKPKDNPTYWKATNTGAQITQINNDLSVIFDTEVVPISGADGTKKEFKVLITNDYPSRRIVVPAISPSGISASFDWCHSQPALYGGTHFWLEHNFTSGIDHITVYKLYLK